MPYTDPASLNNRMFARKERAHRGMMIDWKADEQRESETPGWPATWFEPACRA